MTPPSCICELPAVAPLPSVPALPLGSKFNVPAVPVALPPLPLPAPPCGSSLLSPQEIAKIADASAAESAQNCLMALLRSLRESAQAEPRLATEPHIYLARPKACAGTRAYRDLLRRFRIVIVPAAVRTV